MMMKGVPKCRVTVTLLVLAFSLASAYDLDPLQDFCVALNSSASAIFVNIKFCNDPKLVDANDFFFLGLNMPENTSDLLWLKVNPVTEEELVGLNTLGKSFAWIFNFTPYGLNPPHTHPRGTEILVVLERTLYIDFVTSNADNNRLFTKVLNAGDVFVFPIGLIHFLLNVGKENAIAFAGLSSQNPGVITIAKAVFGSKPPINPDVLAKAF